MNAAPDFEEIKDTFELLDDWEERYGYVIELGKALPPFPEAARSAQTKVEGCVSQVWLLPRVEPGATPAQARLFFDGDSDALIVKGLIAVLRALLSGQTIEQIRSTDPIAALSDLGLASHLSPQRSNGLKAMVARIKGIADAAA
ncbi:MAG: SufE family protein [Neomegalonema sp.]|nr:SufE family protein [Neomegalonema sp.]